MAQVKVKQKSQPSKEKQGNSLPVQPARSGRLQSVPDEEPTPPGGLGTRFALLVWLAGFGFLSLIILWDLIRALLFR